MGALNEISAAAAAAEKTTGYQPTADDAVQGRFTEGYGGDPRGRRQGGGGGGGQNTALCFPSRTLPAAGWGSGGILSSDTSPPWWCTRFSVTPIKTKID